MMMSVDEKQKIANFLDLSVDYLGSGYKSVREKYNFTDDTVQDPAENDSIEQIASEIRECKNCQLCVKRTNAVPGEGSQHPLVMVIGEGPGQDEDAKGRPFVGKAGQLLDKMLSSINLSRNENCFIANVVKCRPPNNRDPYPEETAACAHFIERQISLLKPKFILILGRVAAQALLKTTEPIVKLRTSISSFNVGNTSYPYLVTYHPAALLRNEEYKRPTWEDLKTLSSKLEVKSDAAKEVKSSSLSNNEVI